MSLTNHTPAERAAFRQALDRLDGVPAGIGSIYEDINRLRVVYPALPPLPVIKRWVVVGPDGVSWHGTHLSAPSTWPTSMIAPAGSRIFRLEAVEEVTPTPDPVRVTLDGEVWEKFGNSWLQVGGDYAASSQFSAALDRIAELEAGR